MERRAGVAVPVLMKDPASLTYLKDTRVQR